MNRRSSSPYRNSEMARVKSKKSVFHTIINNKLKQPKTRYNTDTGLVEDRTSSTTVVRVIVGLLLVHLIVIGGVILRGKMKTGDAIATSAPTITNPPVEQVAQAEPVQNDVLPQPVDGPVANPTPTGTNHITQPMPTEVAATPVTTEPEIVNPVVDPAQPAQPAQSVAEAATPAPVTPAEPAMVKHLVASGETLFGIAKKHQTTVEAIRQANPQLHGNNIHAGTYLNVPVKADSAAGIEIAQQRAAEAANEAAKSYTVKRGDTLARIARKHKTTVQKLMELNSIPKGKEGSLRVGDTIRISQ